MKKHRIQRNKDEVLENKILEINGILEKLEKKLKKNEIITSKVKELNKQLNINLLKFEKEKETLGIQLMEAKKKIIFANKEKDKIEKEKKKILKDIEQKKDSISTLQKQLQVVEIENKKRKLNNLALKKEKNSDEKEVHKKLNHLNEKLGQLFEENELKNKEIKALKKEKNAFKNQLEVQAHENKLLSEKIIFYKEKNQNIKSKNLAITPQNLSRITKIKSTPKLDSLPNRVSTSEKSRKKCPSSERININYSPKHQSFSKTPKSTKIVNMIDAMSNSFHPSTFDDGQSMVLSQHTIISNENTIHEINSLRNSVHQLNKQKIDIFKEMTLLNDKYNNSKNENNKLQNLVSTCLKKINQLNEITSPASPK